MPSPQHHLADIDPEVMLATCAIDGPVIIRRAGDRYMCDIRARAKIRAQEASRGPRDRSTRYPGRAALAERLKALRCERCGFEAEDVCQLDVDHIVRRVDGGSDRAENLCILCSNCHRLKTKLERSQGLDFDMREFLALAA